MAWHFKHASVRIAGDSQGAHEGRDRRWEAGLSCILVAHHMRPYPFNTPSRRINLGDSNRQHIEQNT